MTNGGHGFVLSAAVGGDEQALRTLVRTYQEQLRRFGRRTCRDQLDSDDVVQEAFLKLARRPDVQRDPGVLSWLFTVVKNACLRLSRKMGIRHLQLTARLADDESGASAPSPEEALERFRIAECIHAAIARLDHPYREVVILRDLEGIPGPQVCESLGISEAAMKSRLHRARETLRATLQPLLHDKGLT